MFCEKCGNPVNDNDKFCQKCGAPVKPLNAAPQQAPEAPQPEVQPMQAPEAPQPEVQPMQAPEAPQPEVQPVQAPEAPRPEVQPMQVPEGYQPVPPMADDFNQTNVQTVPPAEKKPFPKAAKLGIIFGGIGVAAVAAILVVIFAVIIPMTKPKIDLTKFVTVDLYEHGESVVDGKINGEFELDSRKIVDAYPRIFNGKPAALSALDSALYDIKVEYVDSSDTSNMDYGYKYVTFSNLKKDSEVKITIVLPEKDSFGYESLRTEESMIGASFVGGTVNVNIADSIEAEGYSVVDTENIDLLGYIEKNKLASAIVDSLGEVTMGILPFEAKFGSYTVKNESYESYAPSVYDANDNYITSIYLSFDKKAALKAGDKVTVSYDGDNSYMADNYGLVLEGKPFTYTVAMPEKLDEKSAKKNAEAIKKYITDHPELDSSYKKGDKLEVTDLYYVSWKDNSDYHDIVAIVRNSTQNYYCTLELETKGFFVNGEFIYGGYSSYAGSHGKSTDDAAKSNSYLEPNSKYYTATKLI